MKSVTSPENGQEKKVPAPKGAQKAKPTRAEEIAKAIAHYNELAVKVKHREIFQDKLEEIHHCVQDLKEEAREDWEETTFSVKLNAGSGRTLISFSHHGMIESFLQFMETRITSKIETIDAQILSMKI